MQNPERRPWYRRPPLIIAVAVGAVAATGVIVAIAALLPRSGDGADDGAASTYLAAADEFEAAWTAESVDGAGSSTMSDLFDPAQPFDLQESGRDGRLAERCAAFPADLERVEALASTVPAQPEEGTGGPEVERRAAELGPAVAAASEFVEVAGEALPELERQCRYVQAGVDLRVAYEADEAARLAPLRSLTEGQSESVGSYTLTCLETEGCASFSDPTARAAYGDAYQSVYGQWIGALRDQEQSSCQFPDLPGYCEQAVASYEELIALDVAIAEAFRTEPFAVVDGVPFPGIVSAYRAREAYFEEPTDPETIAAWREVDPNYPEDPDADSNEYLGVVLTDLETRLVDAREEVLANLPG